MDKKPDVVPYICRPAWWWLAGAFAVSWLADTMAHFGNPWLPVAVYPLTQSLMVGTLLLENQEAVILIAVLTFVALVEIFWEGVSGPHALLQTVAFGSVVGIAWSQPEERLKLTLVTAFGLGGIAWLAYLVEPGWTTWGFYQAVRAVSLGMFCWANRAPRLALA